MLLVTAVALEAALVLLLLLKAALAAHVMLILVVVVVVAVGLVHVQLVLLEDQLLLLERQHLRRVLLVVVGDKAEAARVADLIGDDTSVLDQAKVREVVSQLVLRCLNCKKFN